MDSLTPPNNQDAEVQVLGAAMFDAHAATLALEGLKPGDFYHPAHADIFRAIQALAEDSQPIDAMTVCNQLRTNGKLDAIGGMPYVAEVANAVYTTANVEHHARVVRECSTRRKLLRASERIRVLAFELETPTAEAIERAEQIVVRVGDRDVVGDMLPLSQIVKRVHANVEARCDADEPTVGLSVGLSDLDNQLGGLRPGQLIILAARPAMGKTAFAMQIATTVAKAGPAVAVFSLEMDADQIGERMVAAESQVIGGKLKHGWMEDRDWQSLVQATGRMSNWPVFLDDAPGVSLASMRAKCRRLKLQQGGLGLIVVDYLQLMDGSGKDDNRANEIGKLSRGLKLMAREFNCPVLALSQLNRGVEQRQNKRPMLSDLRDSGSIEQDADVVLFLYRDDYYNADTNEPNVAEVIVAKQRSGPTCTVKTFFRKELTKFESLALEPYA